MKDLAEATSRIGDIVRLISDITAGRPICWH